MDEADTNGLVTVGERLREARERKKLSVEDVAASTRIPTRHLRSLETGDWDQLPAPTYTMGFAKSYADAVGLDRDEIGEQLRTEMGGFRPVYQPPVELFEPADPKRAMPKGLVFGALGAIILVALLLSWMSRRSLEDDGATPVANEAVAENAAPVTSAPPAPASNGPVLITASEAAWIEVKDGQAILKQGELAAGQSFEVPANAVAPVLTTAKPEALRISVGTADAPSVGEPGRKVSGVSLRGADLLKGPTATATPATAPAASLPAPTRTSAPRTVRDRAPVLPASTPAQAPAPEPAADNVAVPATLE